MSEVELNRRRVHGVLSSKSLLESLNSLVVNKPTNEKTSMTGKSSLRSLEGPNENPLVFKVSAANSFLTVPESLTLSTSGKSVW